MMVNIMVLLSVVIVSVCHSHAANNTLTVFLFELFAVDLWKVGSKHFLLLMDYRTKPKKFISLLIPMYG